MIRSREAASSSSTTSRDPFRSPFRAPPPEDAEPSVSPEDAPQRCASCSQLLTVGERMFYFLEGAGSIPTCRACLARRQGESGLETEDALALASLNELGSRYDGGAAGSRALAHAVRSFLQDELDRIDLAVDHFPKNHPDLPLVQSVQQEAQDHLSHDRLAEAIVSMSDLRRILTEIDRGRKRVPLSSPWDEGIEELFDRVVARARAMSRRFPPLPEGEGELTESPPPGASSTSRASS